MGEVRTGFVGRKRELEIIRSSLIRGLGVAVIGSYGAGKTALVRVACDKFSDMFPGGVVFASARPEESLEELFGRHFQPPIRSRSLLVIDEADRLPVRSFSTIALILEQEANLRLMFTAAEDVWSDHSPSLLRRIQNIHLQPLSTEEMIELARLGLGHPDYSFTTELVNLAKRNVAFLDSVLSLVRDKAITPREALQHLKNFDRPGILGPDGYPISPDSLPNSPMVEHVISANERLLELVRRDPQKVFRLGSRQFEELVAELLHEDGYRVTLTPPKNDGGVDIYAARHDRFGEFLYLVECKRYSPNQPVGVEIVRALHGVVEQRQAAAGIVVTTSRFTRGAIQFHQSLQHKMSLRDYIHLRQWLTSETNC